MQAFYKDNQMKKLTLISLLLFTAPSYASTAECYVPKECKIVSSEFSTGGGDKAFYITEVDCQQEDGMIVKYVDTEFSIGGLFGMGRISTPDKIIFKPREDDKDKLDCDY